MTSAFNASQRSDTALLLEALQVFVDVFGMPESDIDLKGTVGALLVVMDDISVASADVEAVIAETVKVFQQKQILQSTLKQVVTETQDWLEQQELQLMNVVSGYVQQFAPQIEPSELAEVVQIAVAMLGKHRGKPGSTSPVSASEARRLALKVIQSFDLDLALRRWVAPEVIEVAQQVAAYRDKPNFESGVMAIVQVFLDKFDQLLSPELIKQIIENGGGNINPQSLLDGELDVLSDTIFLRWQLKKASPKITKTDEQMADEIFRSVQTFRNERLNDRNNVDIDLTKPLPLGDLEVGSVMDREP